MIDTSECLQWSDANTILTNHLFDAIENEEMPYVTVKGYVIRRYDWEDKLQDKNNFLSELNQA